YLCDGAPHHPPSFPTRRSSDLVDPEFEGFRQNLERFGEISGHDTLSWPGYLDAHRERRAFFRSFGATSTDHGHPTAATAALSGQDRKSTRLNSSHVKISYAVFC